jgi:hypothetical protein
MGRLLRNNPWDMLGTLHDCVLLNFSVPAELVRSLLPPALKLVEHNGWALWNVVLVRISAMRPWPLPALLGIHYHHVAYRLIVEADLPGSERRRGLYFVRSDCDKRLVAAAGKLITDFGFHTARISADRDERGRYAVQVRVPGAGALVRIDLAHTPVGLPPRSVYSDEKIAKDHQQYRPWGIGYDSLRHELNMVQVVRALDWRIRRVALLEADLEWLAEPQRGGVSLRPELAFYVERARYRWRRRQIIGL